LRILVLTPTFLPVIGGAELVLWEVYRRLAARHEVVLLTPRLSESLLRHYSKNEADYPVNFRVIRYDDTVTLMSIRGHKISGGAIPPFSISAVLAVKKALEEFDAHVLNVHYVMPTGLAGAIANTLGRGVVTWNGVDFDKIRIRGAEPLREKLDIKKGTHVLFALQRLSVEKKVDVLLKSMRYIVEKVPNTELIIGGTGPDKDRLMELGSQLNLQDKVRFVGFIPDADIGDYFNLCDAFVFNTTYETFGIVLAQAMAFGKPVVSVLSTAVPSVVRNNECGLLVPVDRSQKMAEAVVRLLNNENLRIKLGNNGRKRAGTFFDWDVVTKKYEKVFLKAINQNYS
jgi:glycosyltransferase involved in cell wall biosynthesis